MTFEIRHMDSYRTLHCLPNLGLVGKIHAGVTNEDMLEDDLVNNRP